VPVWRIQPSASARAHDGQIVDMALDPIHLALQQGIVPLIYGDVSLDHIRGGTIISTEKIFFYLARHLPVSSILLLGEVDGVYDPHGSVIPCITPENIGEIEQALGGSAGTDVTGGMETKVRDMVALTAEKPVLQIRIMNGMESGLLGNVLLGQRFPGTLIESANATHDSE
jgi:isopentenyl phosphate kinase